MNTATTIETKQLRAALDLVLCHVEQTLGPTIELAGDYYWTLPPEAIYDSNAPPPTEAMTLAQLSDDVLEIRGVLEREEVILWHDLAHLVGVLQRIAAQDLPTE